GPRTIDLDIVLYEDEKWQTASLTIPHPEMGNRRFVLQPLLDVMDDDPVHQERIKQLLQNTTDHNWIRPVE
ncbi:2-amino-4-hydroxy-6-hydroxymethyldihydropteridine diphosphokinase, partial [Limosilactobacillus mucosae]|nr:2-amino-4-hydroxy-6-hydroxymethyldihydropteridine diphosphokinase [Limosilactobacillus mucosae]